jgi:protein-S-isoprenylcysteine O-methyltransferase Ste14
VLSYLLAVLAACANATSSVLQRKANREVPRQENLSWKLVWSLIHEPVWFGGILAIIVGFLLQATALGNGQLATVEPILVLELPATLILASRVFGSRLHGREWASIAVMTAGLAGLLYSLSPSAGRSAREPWYVWVIGIAVNLVLAGCWSCWRGAALPGKAAAGGAAAPGRRRCSAWPAGRFSGSRRP